MRFARCVLPVFIGFFLFLSWSAHALTQAEVTQAMLDALQQYTVTRSTLDTLAASPVDVDGRSLSRYLISSGLAIPDSVGYHVGYIRSDVRSVLQTMAALTNRLVSVGDGVDDMRDLLFSVDDSLAYAEYYLWNLDSNVDTMWKVQEDMLMLQGDISNLVLRLADNVDTSNETLANMLTVFDDLVMNVANIYDVTLDVTTYLDDSYEQLYYIRQHTEDTASSTSQILHWLENNILRVLAEAYGELVADLPTHYDVTVDNLDELKIPDYSSDFSNLDTGLHRLVENSTSNLAEMSEFHDDFNRLSGDIYAQLTNYFAGMTLTPNQSSDVVFITNSIATNSVVADESYEREIDYYTNRLDSSSDQDESWRDRFTENPYDNADTIFENLEDSVNDLAGRVDPATTSDVILLGSIEPSRTRYGWPYWVQKLPRVGFNLEYLFTKWGKLATIKNLFRALWLIVGVFFRLILLWRFAEWFARVAK